MQHFLFRAEGVSEDHLRRWRRLRQPVAAAKVLTWALAVAGVVYVASIEPPIASAIIAGVIPGVFETDGGSFELTVTPLDPDDKLIRAGLTLDSFSFTSLTASDPASTQTSTGYATPTKIEILSVHDPTEGLTAILVLDTSGSMEENDPGEFRKRAAKEFVDQLTPKDQVAVLAFGPVRFLQEEFTSDPELLRKAIDQVGIDGGTPLYDALSGAVAHLAASEGKRRAIIVLTDGEDSGSSKSLEDVITEAKAENIPNFAIGLGENVDFSPLRRLARKTDGTFIAATDAEQLTNLFKGLAVVTTQGRVVVHATSTFDQPLSCAGPCVVSGNLITSSGRNSVTTPFSFRVVQTARLETPAEVAAGAGFAVSWTGPGNDGDYVTIVEAGAAQGSYLSYAYTNSGTPLTLTASETPGLYEVRYVMGQSKRILASTPVTVRPLSASLEAPSDTTAGVSFEVLWTGPNNPEDFIAIAKADAPAQSYESRAYSRAGHPATLFTPSTPGAYEIRYVLAQSDSILAAIPISVTSPEQ